MISIIYSIPLSLSRGKGIFAFLRERVCVCDKDYVGEEERKEKKNGSGEK